MGEVIELEARRRRRASSGVRTRGEAQRTEFLFDLACPFTYLAAERVERAFESVTWTPVSAAALTRRAPAGAPVAGRRTRRAAEVRAAQLRMPLVWPERFPGDLPAA